MSGSDDGPDRREVGTDREAGTGHGSGSDGDVEDADRDESAPFGGAGPLSRPVEPGSPSLENAAFVLLGVASMIALVVHLVSLLG